MAFEVILTTAISLSLYMGFCIYIKAMVNDLKSEMSKINRHLMRLHARPNSSERNCIQIALIDQIQFHHLIIR